MKTPKWMQTLFTKAYKGLAKQKFQQSRNEDSIGCRYRGAEGRKCAVGQLIADKHYKPELEGGITASVIQAVRKSQPACKGIKSSTLGYFLEELQPCHDDASKPSQMRANLASLAKDFGLRVPKL